MLEFTDNNSTPATIYPLLMRHKSDSRIIIIAFNDIEFTVIRSRNKKMIGKHLELPNVFDLYEPYGGSISNA